MTPEEYILLDSPELVERVGLTWNGEGYGLLLCLGDDGRRCTVGTADVGYFKMLLDAPASARASLVLDPELFPITRQGWPGDPDFE